MRFAPAVGFVLLLAGCLGGNGPTSSSTSTTPLVTLPPGPAFYEGFDAAEAMPSGWTGDGGTWDLLDAEEARSAPHVLEGVGGGGRSTFRSPGSYLDFEATVNFTLVSGEHPQGAGLSFRYEPDGDYRAIRFSMSEQGWHYFVVEDGTADKRNEATVGQEGALPGFNDWIHLRIRAEGSHVQAWQDGTLVIDYTEDKVPQAGAIGPFVRGSTKAWFDDIAVTPL